LPHFHSTSTDDQEQTQLLLFDVAEAQVEASAPWASRSRHGKHYQGTTGSASSKIR
jgi:hypothetical protein